jgi:hypothetical protein
MSNPYAPPSTAAVAPKADPAPLPPGVRRHRLDPEAYRSMVNRVLVWPALLAALLFPLVLAPAFAAGVYSGVTTGVFWIALVGAVLFRLALVRRTALRRVPTYELLASQRVLRRVLVGSVTAEVLRPEVTRIVETPRVLWVLCASPRRSLGIPRAVEAYAELRERLATWSPIVRSGRIGALARSYAETAHVGPRDVVAGTALAGDATLVDELALVRAAGADGGAGYGAVKTRDPRVRLLVVWLLLVVAFLAIWQLVSSR